MSKTKAYHGGSFFEAIGEDFSTLWKSKDVIAADVLDAWFDPAPNVTKKIRKYLNYAIRVPPPTHAHGLIKTISTFRKVPRENILVGGGSSDLMFVLFPQIVKKGESVLILDPMYGEYAHIFENVLSARVFRHALLKENNFEIKYEKLLDDVKRFKPKTVVLVNPNSPTGVHWKKRDLLKFISAVPKNTKVVVDETYIDYVGKEHSVEREVLKNKNLVIIKSMSKVYALSGVRVGYLVADKGLILQLSKFVPPWAVSFAGQIAGVEALINENYYNRMRRKTDSLRKQMMKGLSGINSIKVYDSVANFFMVELLTSKASDVVSTLRGELIYLRNCDSMGKQFSDNFIRIAVKDRKANKKIVRALRNFL